MSSVFNPYLMLLVFCVFMILIFFLNSWLYRPMLHFIRKRNEFFNSGLSALSKDKARMEEIQVEIQRLLIEAKQEAKEIKKIAIQEAQQKYNESFERAKIELELHFNEQKEDLMARQKILKEVLDGELQVFSNLVQDKIQQSRSV